jgi:hypothetical protein
MFIPRHPVVENQFCQFYGQTTVSGGAGDVLAYAGSVCYLDATQTNATVKIYTATETNDSFGMLMQKVKTGYHSIHPAGFMMPGDLGSSDVIAQPSYNSNGQINGSKPAPVAVAHLGIWDTIHYYSNAALNAGTNMGVKKNSMSELDNVDPNLTAGMNAAGDVAIVVKGASAAQVTANVQNTTLYPIRIKLLV